MRKRMRWIAAAVTVGIVIVGSSTGVRNVRSEAVQIGMAAMKDENYALVVENLQRAIKLGDRSKEVADTFAKASMEIGRYRDAVKVLEKQKNMSHDMKLIFRNCCSRIADEELNASREDEARVYLKKAVDFTDDHDAKIRLEALQKGSYTEEGITYNAYGDPTSIQRQNCSAELLYDQGKLSKVRVNSETYSNFSYTDDRVFYELFYNPQDGLCVEKIVKEDGYPVKRERMDKDGTKITRFSWHDNGNGRLTSISWWSMLDDSSGSWNLKYEDGRVVSADQTVHEKSNGTFKKFLYDEKGRLSEVLSYVDLIQQIERRSFVYDKDGKVEKIIVETPSSYHEYVFSSENKKADILDKEGNKTGLLIPIGYGNIITLEDIC